MRIVVLGAGGMLGSMVYRVLCESGHEVEGTWRSHAPAGARILDLLDDAALRATIAEVAPDVVINCTGVIKQRETALDPLAILPINALVPHRLAKICAETGARLIQFSTDCVFSGRTGMYRDDDPTDVSDLYGLSKYLGEVRDLRHVLTLRTSIIGHEQSGNLSLIEWFLAQEGRINGFTRAIFSGFPTVEIGHILDRHVLGTPELSGVMNLSADPISKHDLLVLVREVYGKEIEIVPDDRVAIDRSLDSSRFRAATGYTPPPWPELIAAMHRTR